MLSVTSCLDTSAVIPGATHNSSEEQLLVNFVIAISSRKLKFSCHITTPQRLQGCFLVYHVHHTGSAKRVQTTTQQNEGKDQKRTRKNSSSFSFLLCLSGEERGGLIKHYLRKVSQKINYQSLTKQSINLFISREAKNLSSAI